MTLQERFTGVILNGFKGQTLLDFIDALKEADEDIEFLNCLRAAGVDNWEGYECAQDLMEYDDDDE